MSGHGARVVRVLAADDSKVMRGVLRTVFQLHAASGDPMLPPMELLDVMRDGVEALEAVRRLCPDVLLLDLEMPMLNGLEVLQRLRTEAPSLPVIMCSASTDRGARATLDALSYGAKDYVMKPGQGHDFAAALDTLMSQLLPKIAALANPQAGFQARVAAPFGGALRAFGELPGGLGGAGAQVAGLPGGARAEVRQRFDGMAPAPAPISGVPSAMSGRAEMSSRAELIVIGVSTGGPSALELVLPRLPRHLSVPVMIVQHMPRLFTKPLAERLDRLCALGVQQAVDGMPVRPGTILLAPGDAHMEVAGNVGEGRGRELTVRLHQGPPLNSCMPSADYLFRSAARVCGAGVLGVVMTGMGADGFNGARALREAGSLIVAQDEASSAVWGMPGRVVEAGLASSVAPLSSLAEVIAALVGDALAPLSSLRGEASRLGFGRREAVLDGLL